MNIRTFELRDLPVLHRYRNQGIFFDSILALTRGPILVTAGALFAFLPPVTGTYTFLCQDEEQQSRPWIGQVSHVKGSSAAHLTYLAPQVDLDSEELLPLFEHLAIEVGERGALYILAEVEEQSAVFATLRQAGFSIYARQRLWLMDEMTPVRPISKHWRAATRQDEAGKRFLYANLVPGLVQQVEMPPANRGRGLVYYRGNELLAYVELHYGLAGVWGQPFVHPDAGDIIEELMAFLQNLSNRHGRPVYICVRSYQSWLEPVVSNVGGKPGPQQAVLVKHLTIPRRAIHNYSLPVLNNSKTAEPTVPITHIKNGI